MNKKKITILVLLAAFFAGFSANAKIGIGPIVGVNINKMSVSKDVFDSENRAGFNIGLTAEYIAPVIGIGADISLMYSWQNAKVEKGGLSDNIKSNFFQIPLHLKYKLSLPAAGSIIAPYIFTGPNAAFRLGGEDDVFKTKTAQWGWDLGLGVQLIKHLQISAGYTFGINSIMDKQTLLNLGSTTGDIKVKNNYWTVTAAWMF